MLASSDGRTLQRELLQDRRRPNSLPFVKGFLHGYEMAYPIESFLFRRLRRPSSSGLAPRAAGLPALTMKVVRRQSVTPPLLFDSDGLVAS